MTSRAHNTLFRHFNPPSKAAASFQWTSFGTFPWNSIGKAIGFHASCLARWWHTRWTVWRLGQTLVLPLPKTGGERQHHSVSPRLGFQVGECGVLSEAEGPFRYVSTTSQPFLSQRCLVSFRCRIRGIS